MVCFYFIKIWKWLRWLILEMCCIFNWFELMNLNFMLYEMEIFYEIVNLEIVL